MGLTCTEFHDLLDTKGMEMQWWIEAMVENTELHDVRHPKAIPYVPSFMTYDTRRPSLLYQTPQHTQRTGSKTV